MQFKALLGLLALAVAMPADAALLGVDVAYAAAYQQTAPATTSLTGFFFSGRAFMAPDDYDAGTLSVPGGAMYPLSHGTPDYLIFQTGYYADLASLELDFGAGSYTFDVLDTVTSETDSVVLDRSAPLLFSSTPLIANYAALQSIDPTANFSIELDSGFIQDSDATSAFSFVTIFDQTTNAFVYTNGFNLPSTTSFFVAANTLTAGHDYAVETVFSNRLGGFSTNFTSVLSDVRTLAFFSVPLAPVATPEPGSWAMMIAGLGVAGMAMRRARMRGQSSIAA